MGRQVFTAGEILTAANMNDLSDQTVMVFDDSADRDSAIPTPSEGMVTYLKDTESVEVFKGAAFAPVGGGFTDSETITATDATWSVPTLASPIVKVTVCGGGGGGGGGGSGASSGSTGGTTTFNAGGAGTVSAVGGNGGIRSPYGTSSTSPLAATLGMSGGGGGGAGGHRSQDSFPADGGFGHAGKVTVAYLDLTGISTVNVTIGAGGGGGGGQVDGGAGGRGEVIVEYVAA